MKHKSYPECRQARMPFVSKLPTHWHTRKLKHLAKTAFSSVDKHSLDDEIPVRLCNYVNVYYHDRITSELDFMRATATSEEIARFTLKPGDVLVTKDSEEWDDIAIPSYVSPGIGDVVCGYHLAQVRPNPATTDGRYLSYAFSASGLNDQFRIGATGVTRYGLGKYALDNANFPVPTLPEQRAIAVFLDRETAKIDALIAKKQEQIILLQKKRAALISQAVTKGLDPNATTKDSGVEWIGRLPTNWTLARLSLIAQDIQTGPFGSQLHSELYVKEGAAVINPSNIIGDEVVADPDCTVDDVTFERLARHRLCAGDIVFARRGEMGRCALITGRSDGFLCGTGCIRLRFKDDLASAAYYAYYLRTPGVRDFLSLESVGSTMENLNTTILSRIPVPIPPISEQEAIVTHINTHDISITRAMGLIKDSILRLSDYRTALIAAAVTGKIDVRQEVAID